MHNAFSRLLLLAGALICSPAMAAEGPNPVVVVNPVTLNPATPNPVTIINPPGSPSTVTLNPATPNPVTIANPVVTRVNRYQEFGSTDCTLAGDCAILFPAVTAETLILHASCGFTLQSAGSVVLAAVGTELDNPRNALQTFANSIGTALGATSFAINADAYLFVNAGDKPRIDVVSANAPVQDLLCTLSGNKNTQ